MDRSMVLVGGGGSGSRRMCMRVRACVCVRASCVTGRSVNTQPQILIPFYAKRRWIVSPEKSKLKLSQPPALLPLPLPNGRVC